MALPKSFGSGERPNSSPLPPPTESMYGNAPSESLPSFDDISEESPFMPISPSEEDFYSEDSLRGSAAPVEDFAPAYNMSEQQYPPAVNQPIAHQEPIVAEQVEYTPSPEEIDRDIQQRVQEELDRRAAEASTDFVDAKEKKIKPFGSGSKRKPKAPKGAKKKDVKVNDFDARKNLRNRNKIAVIAVIFGIVFLIAAASYKIFLSKDNLSEADVVAIASTVTGDTGYPLETGAAIAESFMKAYLTAGDDGTSDAVLAYYYGSSSGGGSYSSNRDVYGRDKYSQKIVSGPFVFEQKTFVDYSAAYTVGALVTSTPPVIENADGKGAEVNISTKTEWLFFNVNVNYDKATDSFSISPDSPTIVPPPKISSGDFTIKSPGNGVTNEAVNAEISPIVTGFFEKFAETTPDNWEPLTAYVVTPFPEELKDGLGGQFDNLNVANMSVTAYETDFDPNDPTAQIKAWVKITWSYSAIEGDIESQGMSFVSNYIATLDKKDGSYRISKIAPMYFVKAEEN